MSKLDTHTKFVKLNEQLLRFMCLDSNRLEHMERSTHDIVFIVGS